MLDVAAELQRIARLVQISDDRAQLESALDDVEYLMEVLDPELQPGAYALHAKIREKLGLL
jgi:DnaJ-domain-containing protein 1